jgi:hypothetical protein
MVLVIYIIISLPGYWPGAPYARGLLSVEEQTTIASDDLKATVLKITQISSAGPDETYF